MDKDRNLGGPEKDLLEDEEFLILDPGEEPELVSFEEEEEESSEEPELVSFEEEEESPADELVLDLDDEPEVEIISPEVSLVVRGSEIDLSFLGDDVLPAEIPDNVLDFFRGPSEDWDIGQQITFDDENYLMDLEESSETSLRVPTEDPPAVSAAHLLDQYENSLKSLKRVSESGNYYAREEVSYLGKAMESSSIGFLNAMKRSKLMLWLSTMDSPKDVLAEFIRNFPDTGSGDRIRLSTAIDKILTGYKEFKRKQDIQKSLRSSTEDKNFDFRMNSVSEDLSNIRLAVEEDKICYVREVIRRVDGISFICGNCMEKVESEDDFVKLVVHEKLQERGRNLQVFPRSNECTSCGYQNMISENEHIIITNKLNNIYSDNLAKWMVKSTPKLSSGVNIISYTPRRDQLSSIYPALFKTEENLLLGSFGEEEKDFSDVMGWYDETVAYMETLKSVTTDETEQVIAMGENGIMVLTDPETRNLYTTAKTYCELFGEDFEVLRSNALNTLLLYFREHPTLISVLVETPLLIDETYLAYENYLSETPNKAIYEAIFNKMGIDYDMSNRFWRIEVPSILEDRLKELKTEHSVNKVKYEKTFEYLEYLLPMFALLEINSVSAVDMDELKEFLCLPRVQSWLDRVSLLMIQNKLAPQALGLWKTLKSDRYKHSSMFNANTKKSFPELVEIMLKSYTSLYMEKGYKRMLGTVSSRFLSLNTVDRNTLSHMYDLRSSIENFDEYLFHETIISLQTRRFMFKYVPTFGTEYDRLLREAKEFMSDRPENSLVDYYTYYYGDMFTAEEIEEGCQTLREKFKKHFVIPREEGETFLQYIDKVKVAKYDPEVHTFREYLFFRTFKHLVPVIYAYFEYFRAINSLGDGWQHHLLMNDLMHFSFILGVERMGDFLGIPAPLEEDLEGSEDTIIVAPDYTEYRSNFFIKSLVYLSDEVNGVLEGEDSNYPNLDVFMTEEPEIFISQLKHLGSLGGELIEHYFSRGTEISAE